MAGLLHILSIWIYFVNREHADGASQELCILRAERSSAPTDHRRKYLYTAH